ncbi:MAG: hypothetical protein RLY93_17305 [Sumerlaeia bacterium]
MIQTRDMSPNEIVQTGLELLSRELGIVGRARFLRQLGLGLGNWTEERREIFADRPVEELIEGMRRISAESGPPVAE